MTITLNGTTGITTPTDTATTSVTTPLLTSPASTALTIQSGGTTAMTVDTSQNVGIGTSSPGTKLEVAGSVSAQQINGRYFGFGTAGFSFDGTTVNNYGITYTQISSTYNTVLAGFSNIKFVTNQSEAMRIDSSGNLLVGTTSQYGTEKFNVTQSATSNSVADFVASSTSFTNDVMQVRCATAAGTTFNLYTGWAAGTSLQFLVRGNGNTANTNNSFGAISDVKLKENIVDATPKLSDLLQVKIRNYNLIADEAKVKQIGVIAQELETVFPGLIEEIEDRDPDGNDLGTKTKSVKYSVFVPMLIKAIQELSAKNDALAAQVTELSAKVAVLEQKGE